MKRLAVYAMCSCAAVSLSVVLASGVAKACAREVFAGGSGNEYVHCSLTGSDANWCYYDCTCSGPGDCEDIYSDLGFEAY